MIKGDSGIGIDAVIDETGMFLWGWFEEMREMRDLRNRSTLLFPCFDFAGEEERGLGSGDLWVLFVLY